MADDTTSSYTPEFCSFLESRLTDTFVLSDNEATHGFWCDGISMPFFDHYLTKKHVNDKRKIETKAWLGRSGQEEYSLTIHFGPNALRRYAKGASLQDCVPPAETDDWLMIDTTARTLEIYLR